MTPESVSDALHERMGPIMQAFADGDDQSPACLAAHVEEKLGAGLALDSIRTTVFDLSHVGEGVFELLVSAQYRRKFLPSLRVLFDPESRAQPGAGNDDD